MCACREVLIEKHYAGFQTRTVVETFMKELSKHSNPLDLPPVIATAKNFVFHLRAGELIFLATHRKVLGARLLSLMRSF